jgi:hypothetical protein
MKTALVLGMLLTLVALPAAQYARSGQSAGGYQAGNVPAVSAVSQQRYAALDYCTSQARSQVPSWGQDVQRDRYFVYSACMAKYGLRP